VRLASRGAAGHLGHAGADRVMTGDMERAKDHHGAIERYGTSRLSSRFAISGGRLYKINNRLLLTTGGGVKK
jgi:hypothetical protein